MQKYDLGNGIIAHTTLWAPDRELNPQYVDVPDIDPCGLIIEFPDGCKGSVLFNLPGVADVFGPSYDTWDVYSLDPLNLAPSILQPGRSVFAHHRHHGYIRGGKWEDA